MFILYVQFFFSIALHKRNYLQQSNQTKQKLSINHNLKFPNEILFFFINDPRTFVLIRDIFQSDNLSFSDDTYQLPTYYIRCQFIGKNDFRNRKGT